MRKVTLCLPDELHERLRREARATHVSMAELIRRRLGVWSYAPASAPQLTGSDPLAEVEGIARDGQLTEDVDGALYWR